MNKLLMFNILLSPYNYESNFEYNNLNEEEKKYIDYVDECLNETDERFSDTCTRLMLFILDAANKLNTNVELTNEEIELQKKKLLSGFSQEEKDRLESFMYACIQIMGIYSEERIEERKNKRK